MKLGIKVKSLFLEPKDGSCGGPSSLTIVGAKGV